ncbi:MAG TPA: AbrB family transcriptional regulator [Actinobacteria bacterium]|nr:AbrB family transcriptional regulator [Actinomycetes bacterium]HEX21433.1 AbrB family transcriptional regulator [Actinomycetota bacterium]
MKKDFHKCYGTTTMGERGQVVIPAEARRAMKLTPGDKLIVIGGHGNHPLLMVKADNLAATISHLTEKVNFLKELNGELEKDK